MEWRHFSYEPKAVSFANGTGSASSRDNTDGITLPQFSSASVPQVTKLEAECVNNTNSSDFILFAGGNVWALDWCPSLCDKPSSPINCEYLTVAAHPPRSSYHKFGMPLIGRGIIQIWCLVAPCEKVHPHQSIVACSNSNRKGRPRKTEDENICTNISSNPLKPRGRPKKTPDGNNSIDTSSNPPKSRGRPRKRKLTTSDDHSEPRMKKPRGRPRKYPLSVAKVEPSMKRPRGRPRKYPLSVASVEDSSKNSKSQDSSLADPLVASTIVPSDLALVCAIPTTNPVESTPRKGKRRPRKIPVDKSKGSSGVDFEEDMSTALIIVEPNKSNVRPPKCPDPSNNKHISGTDTELVRETTCLIPSVGCSFGHAVVAVDTALPVPSSSSATCEKKSRDRRGRGQTKNETISSVHPSAGSSSSDAALLAHDLCHANCKEESSIRRGKGRRRMKPISTDGSCSTAFIFEEQEIQTVSKSSDHVASVENCKKEPCPREDVQRSAKKSTSNESSSPALSREMQDMERSSTSIVPNNHLASVEDSVPLGPSDAGLIGIENGFIGYQVSKSSGSNTANQVVSFSFENRPRVIDEVDNTEPAPFKVSSKNDTIVICPEKSSISQIPENISLPRVVLCLAHNGKGAWDMKWKPPLLDQSEQKSHLGFLAILLGNGSLEVWEVPSPSMIQKIYSPSSMEGTDPRFLKLEPLFRCAKVMCGNTQSIPLAVDWSPSPRDMILAGCHDGTVALWNFTTDLPSQDSKLFMCVTAESVPIRALSWAPYVSEESTDTFVTAGENGLKFWDIRDPYHPLSELTTAPRAVSSLCWLRDGRGIVISLEDGTLKFLGFSRMSNDIPFTGMPFIGTKGQGVSTYQLSEYLIWNVHVSEITGYAAYCVADGTVVRFPLNPRFWKKDPGKNRAPYFLCGTLSEEGTVIKIGGTLHSSPLSNVPLVAKKGSKPCPDVNQVADIVKEKRQNIQSSVVRHVQLAGPDEGQETGALVLADPAIQEDADVCSNSDVESPKDSKVLPPKSVALHRLGWNMNKGSERWLCYGGAAGIVRCQRI